MFCICYTDCDAHFDAVVRHLSCIEGKYRDAVVCHHHGNFANNHRCFQSYDVKCSLEVFPDIVCPVCIYPTACIFVISDFRTGIYAGLLVYRNTKTTGDKANNRVTWQWIAAF